MTEPVKWGRTSEGGWYRLADDEIALAPKAPFDHEVAQMRAADDREAHYAAAQRWAKWQKTRACIASFVALHQALKTVFLVIFSLTTGFLTGTVVTAYFAFRVALGG